MSVGQVGRKPTDPRHRDGERRQPVATWRRGGSGCARDIAIARVESIGGRTKKAPSIYARPHSGAGEAPGIDWAVMQDPFGDEFCLVSLLTPEEAAAVTRAAVEGDGDDHHWRVAAGRAAS